MLVDPARTWPAEVLAQYEPALWNGSSWRVSQQCGAALPFDVARWSTEPDAVDGTLLDRCLGPTLDIGCGPGRFVAALGLRGIPALGVDVAATAVAITRAAGGMALQRSVFDPLPGAGRWHVALLADGNIGIGGDAGALLSRLRELLTPGGHALIEVDDIDGTVPVTATISDPDGTVRATFPWLRIGAAPLGRLGETCGLDLTDQWQLGGRHFVALRRV